MAGSMVTFIWTNVASGCALMSKKRPQASSEIRRPRRSAAPDTPRSEAEGQNY
jgi:hypothetical protein